jgi:hypothetical protein
MMMRRTLFIVLLAVASLVAAAPAPAGEDSPWPAKASVRANVRAVDRVLTGLERKVELMEISAERYEDWEACISMVPVTEYGDRDRQWGFLYDERDGTALGHMPALAVDRKSRPGKEDYMFLDFSRESDCQSAAPLAGGTADAAKVRTKRRATAAAAKRRSRAAGLKRCKNCSLTRTVTRLEKRTRLVWRDSQRLETASERFDEWESCVSWVPVTEYGDPDGKYGYLFGDTRGSGLGFRPAITIDRSDWDDPDYMFLAFVGGDRPGGECQDEPGEAVDRKLPSTAPRPPDRMARALSKPSMKDRVDDLQQEVESLMEDVEDLEEPVAEFELFDECMYMIGVTEHGARDGSSGYVYGDRLRPALALDLRTLGSARYRFMAFPGEEPPSIECNEDAGEESIDD